MADEITRALAAYAIGAPTEPDEATDAGARRVVLDSLGAAMAAMQHPASAIGRRYASRFALSDGCVLWGTNFRTYPEIAALVNGALLRCYDFNDLHRGSANGGHPSDMIPGIIAAGEEVGASGREVLTAIEVAYEIAFALMDTFPYGRLGWDYSNITAVGAVCGVGRLMGLTSAQLEHAISITVVPHVAMNTAESNELDAAGELTMWKRFNGSDAIRHSLYAAAMARAGAEGPVRPFVGPMGVLAQVFAPAGLDVIDCRAIEALELMPAPSRMHEVILKRWPVGSRAQAAIHAALEARAECNGEAIERVVIRTDQGAYDHLVRAEAFDPRSRTQADHSLPFVVAVALVDGEVTSQSFSDDRLTDTRVRDMLTRVKIEPSSELTEGLDGGFPTAVTLMLADGREIVKVGRRVPGHPTNPLTDAHLDEKFLSHATNVLGTDGAANVRELVWRLESVPSICSLTAALIGPIEIS